MIETNVSHLKAVAGARWVVEAQTLQVPAFGLRSLLPASWDQVGVTTMTGIARVVCFW
jgi:hypothetical protein